jgi:hypothetical protein
MSGVIHWCWGFAAGVRVKNAHDEWITPETDAHRTSVYGSGNELLNRWHPDHAALRRGLVDARLLDRENGVYRRTT